MQSDGKETEHMQRSLWEVLDDADKGFSCKISLIL